ncbi:hypothetical protein [Candidatus Hakubella thermalkaliphila]|uniref:hypothetical protein n=1 Tax=Candidatus Hakubella thermalkaliphila TaxID=2754717 RepID=UPI001593094A|nr:hypothetical protein [Candidatus Hakubella thermalkaliphila]
METEEGLKVDYEEDKDYHRQKYKVSQPFLIINDTIKPFSQDYTSLFPARYLTY